MVGLCMNYVCGVRPTWLSAICFKKLSLCYGCCISYDIAFGMCHVGYKGKTHDYVVCLLTMWCAFWPCGMLLPNHRKL